MPIALLIEVPLSSKAAIFDAGNESEVDFQDMGSSFVLFST